MLKIVEYTALTAALGFVVCLFVLMFFYSSPSPSTETPQQQHTEKHESKNDRGETNKSIWERARTDPVAFFTLWLVVFTAVLSSVGVIQLKLLTRAETVAEKTANAAKESADAARDAVRLSANTAERQPRAYVALQSGSVIHATVDNVPGFRVTVQLRNFGLTPAYSFTTWIMSPQIAAPDAMPFTPPRPLNERTGTSIIGPNSDAWINWNAQFQRDDLGAIRAGTKAMFIWSGADYTDAFGIPRHFIFRERISGQESAPGGWALSPHPLGYEAN